MSPENKKRLLIGGGVGGVLFLAYLIWRCLNGKPPLLGGAFDESRARNDQ